MDGVGRDLDPRLNLILPRRVRGCRRCRSWQARRPPPPALAGARRAVRLGFGLGLRGAAVHARSGRARGGAHRDSGVGEAGGRDAHPCGLARGAVFALLRNRSGRGLSGRGSAVWSSRPWRPFMTGCGTPPTGCVRRGWGAAFWITVLGFNVTLLPMRFTRLLGMPWRVCACAEGFGWSTLNLVSSAAGFDTSSASRGCSWTWFRSGRRWS